MSLLNLPKSLLKKKIAKMSILTTVGGMLSRRFFGRRRAHWERLSGDDLENVLDYITPYDVARGAGKLLAGWLRFKQPKQTVAQAEKHLQALLKEMDQKDDNPRDQARSRLLLSKALFYLEGFRWKTCRYEQYQQQAKDLLQKISGKQTIQTQAVFQASAFTSEELIGTTHRMLLSLSGVKSQDIKLADYMVSVLENKNLKSDVDYMSRLIALTFGLDDEAEFGQLMLQWLKDYRDFKLSQSKQQEHWVDTSLSAISGGLPAEMGWSLLSKIWPRQKPSQ